MFDYRAEHSRRVAQFIGCLRPMDDRASVIARSSCFIVFEEGRATDASAPELVEKAQLALARPDEALGGSMFPDAPFDEMVQMDLPDEGWRESDSDERFIQFSMERDWFCMDLPCKHYIAPKRRKFFADGMASST